MQSHAPRRTTTPADLQATFLLTELNMQLIFTAARVVHGPRPACLSHEAAPDPTGQPPARAVDYSSPGAGPRICLGWTS